MTRQTQAVEVNSFVKGLITEASPLTFPDNASLDEDNFNLRRDGSRDRRFGMDLEVGYENVPTGINEPSSGELGVSTYVWKNAGGEAAKSLIVVQTGRRIAFFDPDISPLSAGRIHAEFISVDSDEVILSFAVVDGALVVVSGEKGVNIFSYEDGNITREVQNLKIRDLFGVEATFNGRDLFQADGLSVRPTFISQAHRYNLRNQTWAYPRDSGSTTEDTLADPINSFQTQTGGAYPSNSDNLNYALYPNANDESNRTGDQFFSKDLVSNPPGSFPAPKGFFIIDAMERGTSRIEQYDTLLEDNPELIYSLTTLPVDRTPGGAACVAEYAGRVWYGGFSGEVVGGDSHSPKMSSYVFYSKLVQNLSDITLCYQEGDPTSKENPDLLDTDGGFIRVDGAYNIQALLNIGKGLMVVAENGIWMISGGSDYGFSANNNMRQKITERGIQSPGSVVTVDTSFLFWADDAIYQVGPNQFGDYEAQNLTQNTIQTFYDAIDPIDKLYAQGSYDSYDMKVRWVYQNRLSETEPAKELIFDLNLSAFYTHTIGTIGDSSFPRVAAPLEVPPFRLNEELTNVVSDGELVTENGEQVVQQVSSRGSATRELAYVTITGINPITFSFSKYRDLTFKDWVSVDGEGIDAPAFLVTGYMSGGDFLRYKQVPYIQFFFTRTEDGFADDGTGNLLPTNPSGCLVQAQWEWANSANSNRWGRTFQAYRYRRLYMPTGPSDEFDNGFEVVTTKNKLRGKGKVLSLLIKTEPGKDCRLLGWSILVGVTGNV